MDTTPLGTELAALAQLQLRSFGVVLLDPDGTIVGWNLGASLILGYESGDVLGRPFTMLYLDADLEAGKPEHELAEAAATGCASDDNWLLCKDGSRIFASGLSEPLHAGGLRGYVKVFRDVTDRRRIEEELRNRAHELAESDRHKERFLAMLSHELRNPMAPITHAVEVLVQQGTRDDASRRALDVIARQTRQLGHLIEDLLEVTRIASGKLHLRRECVDLVELVRRAIDAARHAAEARRQVLTCDLPALAIHIDGDPGRITQIVANLLDNAIKYTDPGGTVEVAIELVTQRLARVRVRDNGIGIDPNLRDHVFDMFVQDDRHLARAQGGLGIGLALACRLAKLHDGSLEVHSEGRGKGSEFVLQLPVSDSPPPVAQASLEPTPAVAPSAIGMLVVDDNVDGADSIAMLLRILGYSVHVAYDGPTAIETAATTHLDVVLLDIGLPGLDGYAVARTLRAKPGTTRQILVAMTGYGTEADRAQAREAGFDHHLVKPVEPRVLEDLLATIGRRIAER